MPRSATFAQPLRSAARTPRRPLLSRLFDLLALRHQRARLRDLPPHLLQDIGLTEDQARAEAARPLWDAPSHWRG